MRNSRGALAYVTRAPSILRVEGGYSLSPCSLFHRALDRVLQWERLLVGPLVLQPEST